MKTKKQFSMTAWALVAILTLAVTACNGGGDEKHTHTGNPCTVCGYETPHEQLPKTITQAEGLGFTGTVKIITSELYLNKDWDEVVASVIAAVNAAYGVATPIGKGLFGTVFGDGVTIVLVDSLADDHNWEVRDGEFRTLYLKIGSIATATYGTAVSRMTANSKDEG